MAPDARARHPIIARSPAMRAVMTSLHEAAQDSRSVCLYGGPGSGRTMLVAELHRISSRSAGPFVELYCPPLSGTQWKLELFGGVSESGEHRIGALERAHHGTLMLRELGAVPKPDQLELARALAEHRIDGRLLDFDVRIVSTALSYAFADLPASLRARSIRVPFPEERRDDFDELVSLFVRAAARMTTQDAAGNVILDGSLPAPPVSAQLVAELATRRYHGGIRELRNLVMIMLVRGNGTSLVPLEPDE